MVLRQPVLTAEIVSAVGTLKRNERFLPALLTFHGLRTLFLLKRRVNGLNIIPQNSKNHYALGSKRLKPATLKLKPVQ
jgi:hypothetical protein